MSGTELPRKYSDEDVEIAANAYHRALTGCDPDGCEGWPECDAEEDIHEEYIRAVLDSLVASGYRREADVLRHDEEVIFEAWDAAAELLGEAAQGARQRSISANYAEGLADAASTLAETVAELRARRQATALEQSLPLADGLEGQERSEEGKEHG